MPTSFFTNGGHLSPRTMHANNAQGRSSALSQYSDDASIYSSTFVTRTAKNHPSNFLAITPEPIASKTPHESEMPWLNDYSGSKLHLNDQSKRSSMSSLDQDDGNTLEGDEQEDDVPRMSVLGPSLRFHSRAPWELEGDDIDEEEEADYGVLLASSIRSRPSADSSRSSRSQAKSQRSFETTSSQVHPRGALYALAQESLSTSSLGSSSGQAPSLTAFSLARVRSESAGTSSSTTLGVQSSNSIPSKGLSPNAAANSRGSNSRKPPKSETSHPYANPAFALSHESTSSMDQNASATVIRSDSITTVTEPTPSQTASGSKLHTVPSLTSLNFRRKQSAPSIHGKEISHPVAISNSTTHLDDAASIIDIQHSSTATSPKASHFDNIPGWTDRGVPAPFNLISLEEARAQRSRAGTQSSAPHSHTPFPDSLPLPNKRPTADSYDLGLEPHRVRSTSGNGKPKTTLASLVSMSSPSPPKQDQVSAEPSPSNTGPPSGKTIKPRKSGFLRIFGGRASAEKEDKTPTPPPLPPLVTDASQLPWSKRGMIPRSPVHEFVPTFSTSSDDFALSPTETSSHVWPESTSPKRSGPPLNLSINTRSPIDGKTRSSTLPDRQVSTDVATSPVSPQAMPKRPWVDSTQPQSAPANMTEFPALKLRPVSTFFSSQLQDFLDADTSSPEEPITPASATPSNIATPITPISSSGRSEPSQQKAMHKVDHSPKPSSFKTAESVTSSEYSWQQQHIRDLEGQIQNLQAELKELRSGQYCNVCGRGDKADEQHLHALKHQSIVHRPRAPTGNNTARFVNNLT